MTAFYFGNFACKLRKEKREMAAGAPREVFVL